MNTIIQNHKPKILWLTLLLGLLVTSILIVQDYGATNQACVGIGGGTDSALNCEKVTNADPLKKLGISSSILGFIFFLNLLIIQLFEDFKERLSEKLNQWRIYFIYAGFGYLLILTIYQTFFIEGTCLYCLISFVLTGLLTYLYSSESFQNSTHPDRSISPYFTIISAILILGTPYLLNQSLQSAVTGIFVQGDCTFSANVASLNSRAYQQVIQSGFKKGTDENNITIVEFFDPACPHCQDYYPTYKQLTQEYANQVQFIYHPIPVFQQSMPLLNALYAAAEQDKFFELLDTMFNTGKSGVNGVSVYRLNQYLRTLQLNTKEVVGKINNGAYTQQLQQTSQHVGNLGIKGVPTVLFNGKVVSDIYNLENCIRQAL